jgi:hypothetical protein
VANDCVMQYIGEMSSLVVSIKFGSHLYGTATPASDVDYKRVYVPDARSILLQRVKATISKQRPKAEHERNVAGDVDEEAYSLQRYLGLVAEGQTVALDMLFAPDWAMVEPPSATWRIITLHKERLLTRRSAAFVGYCRQQANKYGIKGSRVAAARSALALLDGLVSTHGTTPKLAQFSDAVTPLLGEHSALVDVTLASGAVIRHWDVCGRKLPYPSSIKNARDVVQRLVDEYGHRALMAESQQGVDWKALSHAVRVGTQALEFLSTAHVTFPLPNAAHVKAIKLGELPYQDVAAEIESLLERVEAAAPLSPLPEAPNYAWIDNFVASVYREEVCRA